MSEIVIRHAETRDTRPSGRFTPSRRCITTRYKSSSFRLYVAGATRRSSRHQALVACIDGDVVGHLTIDVQQRHAAVMLPILVSVSTPIGRIGRRQRPYARDD